MRIRYTLRNLAAAAEIISMARPVSRQQSYAQLENEKYPWFIVHTYKDIWYFRNSITHDLQLKKAYPYSQDRIMSQFLI